MHTGKGSARSRSGCEAAASSALLAFVLLMTACSRDRVQNAPPPIPAPTDLTVSDAYAPYQLDFRWTNACLDCSLELQGRAGGGDWALVADIPAEVTAISRNVDPSAPELSQLSFRIRAVQGGSAPRVSDWSNEAGYTFPIRRPHLQALGISGSTSPVSWVELSWRNDSAIADTIVLERGTYDPSPESWTALPVSFGQESFRDEDVRELVTYAYRLRFGTAGAWSEWSSISAPIPLRQPSDVRATVTDGVAQVTWSSWSAAATSLDVLVTDAPWFREAVLPADVTTWRDPVSPPWPTTKYQVEATALTGRSAARYELPVATLGPFRISGPAATLDARAYDLPVDVTARGEDGSFYGAGSDPASGLALARQVGASWDRYLLGFGYALVSPGMTLDASGHPHAVVRGPGDGSLATLTHHWHDGTVWRHEDLGTVPSSATMLSCGFDATGAPQVAYEQVMPWQLWYGSATAGAWAWAPGPDVRADLGFSFAVAPDGTAYLLAEGVLATLAPGASWSTDAVPTVLDGGLVAVSGDTVAVIGRDTNLGLPTCFYVERRAGEWSAPEPIVQVSPGGAVLFAASRDGTRIDVVADVLDAELHPVRIELFRRELGAWSSMPLVGAPSAAADMFRLGNAPAGKLWIVSSGSIWEEP